MENNLFIYNTLTRQKQLFKPINEGRVGMYVCGPTVYGDPHLGHARPAITFDVLFRYLRFLGYKVRYVRNITDVGHLEHDADEGEDKIAKKARLEQLEPMEVAQFFTNRYHDAMRALNVLPPSIEPHATGHIIEQEKLVEQIIDNGYAYVSHGSVYFDTEAYNRDHRYGILSGRNLDETRDASRQLDGVGEKRNQADFALWKAAQPEHIMRWPSPWSDGFPGWHCECTAMGRKYLGEEFDIHGGGMDLVFPHHECEIAQAVAAQGKPMVRYWMHNNMITINGQKMGKSLGNFITLEQFFTGEHPTLNQPYSPMTVRFFILQAHYRGTVDFSNDALLAAQKAYERIIDAWHRLQALQAASPAGSPCAAASPAGSPCAAASPDGSPCGDSVAATIAALRGRCAAAMNDDLNTAQVIATLFDACRLINQAHDGNLALSDDNINELKSIFSDYLFDILGIRDDAAGGDNIDLTPYRKAVDLLLELRLNAKRNKDWATGDLIRDRLNEAGFSVKDTKDGFEWKLQ